MDIPITRTERGFQVYGNPLDTDYGHTVAVYESSGAFKGPVCWMSVERAGQDLPYKINPCCEAVHMTYDQAVAIRDRLNAFITEADAGRTCETREP